MLFLGTFVAASAVSAAACSDDDGTGPTPPSTTTVTATTSVDTVHVSWTAALSATGYRVELTGGPTTVQSQTDANTVEATFTSADGVADATTYTVTVFALNASGETASSNTPEVTTNFFPWDEYFPSSLHETGAGKPTFYMASDGFYQETGEPYSALSCRGCHSQSSGLPPVNGRGCDRCHDTPDPGLGATVVSSLDPTSCGGCHSRQRAEAFNPDGSPRYSDVHTDDVDDDGNGTADQLGCMECHSLGDVHGDGHDYDSMLETGAIDADCTSCHSAANLEPNRFHARHSGDIDCSVCHTQSVVTCYNCHFETQIQADQKVAYGQFKDWRFLFNFRGKVHVANFQSLNYGNETFLAFAPFYSHTISTHAVTSCDDCHSNANVAEYEATGSIHVVEWTGSALTHRVGVIPIPPDYDEGGLLFDFVDLPGGVGTSAWDYLETGPDRFQMPFGTPLTAMQMSALAVGMD
jgi:hypothetical protein